MLWPIRNRTRPINETPNEDGNILAKQKQYPAMEPNKETLKSAIINCLRNIYDPEIPVNIYDLGLIYKVDVDEELNVKILMTMTAPDCPEAEYMYQEVKQMVGYISGVKSVDVELTFDPPWSMDMIPDDIKVELGFM
jgi:FeS assembly SUF system protein